jgi:hypothetical protein
MSGDPADDGKSHRREGPTQYATPCPPRRCLNCKTNVGAARWGCRGSGAFHRDAHHPPSSASPRRLTSAAISSLSCRRSDRPPAPASPPDWDSQAMQERHTRPPPESSRPALVSFTLNAFVIPHPLRGRRDLAGTGPEACPVRALRGRCPHDVPRRGGAQPAHASRAGRDGSILLAEAWTSPPQPRPRAGQGVGPAHRTSRKRRMPSVASRWNIAWSSSAE